MKDDLGFAATLPANEHAVLRAYLNNKAVQQQPLPHARQLCIDFYDVVEEAGLLPPSASQRDEYARKQERFLRTNYPNALQAIDDVRKTRQALSDSSSDREHKRFWWLYGSPRVELRQAWRECTSVAAVGAVGKVWAPTRLDRTDIRSGLPILPMHKLFIAPFKEPAILGVLSAFTTELHVRRTSSTLEERLNFTPAMSMATLAFPWPSVWDETTDAGRVTSLRVDGVEVVRIEACIGGLEQLREKLLNEPAGALGLSTFPSDWGPTKLYNLFDDPNCTHPSIEELRAGHRELLAETLELYGWDGLARAMSEDPDHGWGFSRPWIDGTSRYVPRIEFREALLSHLMQANEDRYWQEINLMLDQVDKLASAHPKVENALRNGIEARKLPAQLEKRGFKKPSTDDALAMLFEGRRQNRWIGAGDDITSVFHWVADTSDAERRHEARAAAKAAGQGLQRRPRAAAASRSGGGSEVDAMTSAPPATPFRRNRPVQQILLDVETPLEASARRRQAAVRKPLRGAERAMMEVATAAVPLGKRDIMSLAELTEQEWSTVRQRLEVDREFARIGVRRGARYVSWSGLLSAVRDVVAATDPAPKSAIINTVGKLDDAIWKRCIGELLERGDIFRHGRGRGTCYSLLADLPRSPTDPDESADIREISEDPDEIAERVLGLIAKAGATGIGKADVVAATGLDDSDWARVRRELMSLECIEQGGKGRGAVYVALADTVDVGLMQTALLILEAIDGAGAGGESEAALCAWYEIGDADWKRIIGVLVSLDFVRVRGRGRKAMYVRGRRPRGWLGALRDACRRPA